MAYGCCIPSILLQRTMTSKTIEKTARSHEEETRILKGTTSLSRLVERAGHLTYLLLFQELSMNKFKLTWGLMSGIYPAV